MTAMTMQPWAAAMRRCTTRPSTRRSLFRSFIWKQKTLPLLHLPSLHSNLVNIRAQFHGTHERTVPTTTVPTVLYNTYHRRYHSIGGNDEAGQREAETASQTLDATEASVEQAHAADDNPSDRVQPTMWETLDGTWKTSIDITEYQLHQLGLGVHAGADDRLKEIELLAECNVEVQTKGSDSYELLLGGFLEYVKLGRRKVTELLQESTGQWLSCSEETRMIMRDVPHPVVVITAAALPSGYVEPPEWSQQNGQSAHQHVDDLLCGMTASSFNTVTLTPVPIISFNIRKLSRTLDAIQKGQVFYVHILAGTSHGADVAKQFASGSGKDAFKKLGDFNTLINFFPGVNNINAPWLYGDAIKAAMACRCLPDKSVDIADHTVVFAEILRVFYPNRSPQGYRQSRRTSLLYVDGGYGSL